MYYKDISIECPENDFVKIYDGNICFFADESILAVQFDSRLKDLLDGELKGKVNSITINHILIEAGITDYRKDLKDLINYIIFDQQNEIVDDRLFIINEDENFHNVALEVIAENQRKISKCNGNPFPTTEKSAVIGSLGRYKFAFANPNDEMYSYVGKAVLETDTYYVDLEEGDDVSDEILYEYEATKESSEEESEESDESAESEKEEPETVIEEVDDIKLISDSKGKLTKQKILNKGYDSVEIREKWTREVYTIDCEKFAMKMMGHFRVSTVNENYPLVITKLVHPHYYKVIPDLEKGEE